MHSFFRGNTCIATKVNFKFIVKNTEYKFTYRTFFPAFVRLQ